MKGEGHKQGEKCYGKPVICLVLEALWFIRVCVSVWYCTYLLGRVHHQPAYLPACLPAWPVATMLPSGEKPSIVPSCPIHHVVANVVQPAIMTASSLA
jgi:hypothetical protein